MKSVDTPRNVQLVTVQSQNHLCWRLLRVQFTVPVQVLNIAASVDACGEEVPKSCVVKTSYGKHNAEGVWSPFS